MLFYVRRSDPFTMRLACSRPGTHDTFDASDDRVIYDHSVGTCVAACKCANKSCGYTFVHAQIIGAVFICLMVSVKLQADDRSSTQLNDVNAPWAGTWTFGHPAAVELDARAWLLIYYAGITDTDQSGARPCFKATTIVITTLRDTS
jgi:hypothetical protein